MKKSGGIVKSFFAGIFFVVVPAIIVIVLFSKALHLLMPLTHKITEALDLKSIFGSAAVLIVGIVIVLLIGVLCGYFLLNGFLKQWSNSFEERLFYFLPSFQIMKYRFVEEEAYKKQKFWEPILLKEDTFYRVAFITDRNQPNIIAIYIPDAPKMDAGEVRYFAADACEYVPITMKQAMNSLHHFGRGVDIKLPKNLN
ncbi:hypothetical protein Q4566_00075 [Tamlana sp. 2_MG-2023]|uniref:hypothetical protein n=1 Tax=unclassified Tamlana TaxID=2614803 RepID=UPI0026E3FA5D|nr:MULTISPECIES: hypothetical protein [unclassified Tamlana]MDO6758577.1 hypothetical protein [Tamlana sp. 2_MG-2023]MDO6789276.1 hypothetical protein [Tamlana sp. 1_MG-2023]